MPILALLAPETTVDPIQLWNAVLGVGAERMNHAMQTVGGPYRSKGRGKDREGQETRELFDCTAGHSRDVTDPQASIWNAVLRQISWEEQSFFPPVADFSKGWAESGSSYWTQGVDTSQIPSNFEGSYDLT